MKNVKSVFGTIVYHVHGLYLLNICGAFNFGHEIMTQIPYFHIFVVASPAISAEQLCNLNINKFNLRPLKIFS